MRAIDAYYATGGVIVYNLLRLVSLLPLRADNICTLRWDQVDLEKAIITIPRNEMNVNNKNLSDFIVPLPHQAINILKEIHTVIPNKCGNYYNDGRIISMQ